MADSAPAGGAAPAAPATNNAPASTNPTPASKGPPGAVSGLEKSKAATPTKSEGTDAKPPSKWQDEAQRKAALEVLKESGLKLRVKGQDKLIDSEESLQEVLRHAQRGVGADKLLAEAKAEREAAAKERAEFAKFNALRERANAGDFEARKELGLVPREELAAREQEWQQVPEEVRAVLEERNRFAEELAAMKAETARREQAETERREQAEVAAAKRVALNTTHEVAEALGIDARNAERYLPHIAAAIADLAEHGLEIGVDMPPELIIQKVKQRIGEMNEEQFADMPPQKMTTVAWAHLGKLSDEQLLGTLPQGMGERISRAIALKYRNQRATGTTPQNGTAARQEAPRRSSTTLTLDPFGGFKAR